MVVHGPRYVGVRGLYRVTSLIRGSRGLHARPVIRQWGVRKITLSQKLLRLKCKIATGFENPENSTGLEGRSRYGRVNCRNGVFMTEKERNVFYKSGLSQIKYFCYRNQRELAHWSRSGWVNMMSPSRGGFAGRPTRFSNSRVSWSPWIVDGVCDWSIDISASQMGGPVSLSPKAGSFWSSALRIHFSILTFFNAGWIQTRSIILTWPPEFWIHHDVSLPRDRLLSPHKPNHLPSAWAECFSRLSPSFDSGPCTCWTRRRRILRRTIALGELFYARFVCLGSFLWLRHEFDDQVFYITKIGQSNWAPKPYLGSLPVNSVENIPSTTTCWFLAMIVFDFAMLLKEIRL